jgi:response regulator RpfG family c-di-GMP phosphodiesterase
MADRKELPRILCVDDEPRIVEGLALHLRREYQVYTANSGAVALKTLQDLGGVAVVVSDMRMPGMDGATLLKRVMQLHPETTRILLTGEPGRDTAVTAINEGQIFRFLTKPCGPDQLKAAIEAGVIQHRLLNAEKVLLQETLVGCIKALIDVLAITNPVAFGRTNRVQRLAMGFTENIGFKGFWQLEAAAMLSQLGFISLPVELVEKIYYGEALTKDEQILASGTSKVASNLLGHIPRLEPVLQILTIIHEPQSTSNAAQEGMVRTGASILKIVLDYDGLVAQGHSTDVAVQTLRSHSKQYDINLLDQFATFIGAGVGADEIQELPLRIVQPGMVFLEDIRTHMGTLLVPKGFEVTATFLERMRNFGSGMLMEKVKVLVPAAKAAAPMENGA